MRALWVKSNHFLNIQSVYKKVLGLKRIVSKIKDEYNFVTSCFYLVKTLPTSDQFNIIMFDNNMYVKHKPSNLGNRNTN